jgi:hypothetical protein
VQREASAPIVKFALDDLDGDVSSGAGLGITAGEHHPSSPSSDVSVKRLGEIKALHGSIELCLTRRQFDVEGPRRGVRHGLASSPLGSGEALALARVPRS